MNLFNCFQAVAFYTALPLGINWAFEKGYNAWGYIGVAIGVISYVALSVAVRESLD